MAAVTDGLDWLLDKSVVLGYSKVGPALRRAWWPADPRPGVLAGRTVVVTGASGGLGLATAAGLAGLGAHVRLVGRDAERLEAAQRRLVAEVPSAQADLDVCDLSDLDAVEAYAARLREELPSLHALVHNAGVLPPERRVSPQGHELTYATHVLGPHALTFALGDLLAGGRVVVVSSGGMYAQPLPEDDYEYTRGTYSGTTAYARTKRMQVVLAERWARELDGQGTAVHSMHPGWADTPGVTDSLPGFAKVAGPILRDARGGADTVVWLVATEEPIGTGRFWHDRRARATHYAPVRVESEAARERLWQAVTEATGRP
ncbi:MAG TPA: SDR family NAD(P)-dependent oxidoreductase [Pedococcus sp.]|nr:SDR family NAD(P)-dependent oxidoreductase [Pedococcus sp.]